MRVMIRPPRPSDCTVYSVAVQRSAEHIRGWNPVDPGHLATLLEMQGSFLRTFLIFDAASQGLVGTCNVANILREPMCCASLGYDSYLPFAGTGRMTEGLRLVIAECFAARDANGLGLHRLEINVQPENVRSIAMAQRLGFRREGFSPRFLLVDGIWRDHVRFALLSEEWNSLPSRCAQAGGARSFRGTVH